MGRTGDGPCKPGERSAEALGTRARVKGRVPRAEEAGEKAQVGPHS